MGVFDGNKGNNSQPPAQQNQQQQEDKKVYRYRAKCNCVVGGVYRREGDIIVSEKKLEVPHFEPVEEK